MTIPTSQVTLTPAWLSSALSQWRGAEVIVTQATVTPLGENKGFFGQLVRVHLQYQGDATDLPATLIAKFSSANDEMRKRSIDSYQREVNFYQQLAPVLQLPTPLCYYANIDPSSGHHLLLLQDLAPAQSGSRVDGCTVEQAHIALHHIVKLHSQWWGRVDGDELTWLPNQPDFLDSQAMQQQYEQWWPFFYQQTQAQLPAQLAPLSQALGSRRAFLRRELFHSAPATLIHRDYQLDNLFFGEPPQAMPFAIVDWQFFSRGRAVWDIAYFLSENLLTDDRRRAEMALLTAYYQTLVGQGITGYSFEQCLHDYRLALLQRHTALVSTIAAMPFSEEQRYIHINILLPRNIAALMDHNAFALLL